jgi:hypothetical protein
MADSSVRVKLGFVNEDVSGFSDAQLIDAITTMADQVTARRRTLEEFAEIQLTEAISALTKGDTSVIDDPSSNADLLNIVLGDDLIAFYRERLTLTVEVDILANASIRIADLPDSAVRALSATTS